jgi:hypothetical protein
VGNRLLSRTDSLRWPPPCYALKHRWSPDHKPHLPLSNFQEYYNDDPTEGAAMSLFKHFVFPQLSFIERSRSIRATLYGLTAFVVIFVPDLIWHFGGWNWSWARLACDALEASLLALIASHLSRLREERLLRRQREMGYLNHHIRNSLSVLQMAEQQLNNTELRASAVRQATHRICTVLEQLTRNEDVSIDANNPAEFRKAG